MIYIDANLPIYSVSIGYGPYIMHNSKLLQKFTSDYVYAPVNPSFEEPKRMRKILAKYVIKLTMSNISIRGIWLGGSNFNSQGVRRRI